MTLTLYKPGSAIRYAAKLPAASRIARVYAPSGAVGKHLAAAAKLQHQIQQLEAELTEHRAWLLAHMEAKGLDRIDSDDFYVLRKLRHNWSYSPETEREMLALRTTQKWEQTQGIALDAPKVYVSISSRPPQEG